MCMDVHHITHSVVVLTLSTYGPPWYSVTINNKLISRRISISCVSDIGDSNILDDKQLDYTRYCIQCHRLYLSFLVSIINHPCSDTNTKCKAIIHKAMVVNEHRGKITTQIDKSWPHHGLHTVESMKHKFFSYPPAQQAWQYDANILWHLFEKKL